VLNRLIDLHLHHQWLVIAGLAGLVAWGLWSLNLISIDAFPDHTNKQDVVMTRGAGHGSHRGGTTGHLPY
jgi:Cu/Ag efflux pump CusA